MFSGAVKMMLIRTRKCDGAVKSGWPEQKLSHKLEPRGMREQLTVILGQ